MENRIGEFNKLFNESVENKEINSRIRASSHLSTYDFKKTHSFYLSYKTNYAAFVYPNTVWPLIELDDEDLEYFRNKYLPKMKEEMNKKIEEIKKEYGAV